MQSHECIFFQAPIGLLKITLNRAVIYRLEFLTIGSDFEQNQSPDVVKKDLAKEVISQLNTYFKEPRFQFNLPLQLEGSTFQRRVWFALQAIPTGKTRTYSEIANVLQSTGSTKKQSKGQKVESDKTSPRAVGNACRHNPIPIIVPCHRVVAKSGLGGFSGQRQGNKLDLKRWLLHHERFNNS